MSRSVLSCTLMLLALQLFSNVAVGRVWSSANGAFEIEGEEISFNETLVVLKRPNGELVALELKELSSKDQEYVRSKQLQEKEKVAAEEMQTWTAKDGMKVRGKVVAYGRKEMVVQRKLGHVHVNDKKFSTIDALHQKLVLRILSVVENTKLEDEKQLEEWAKKLGGNPKTYPLEGVLMQLESGDEIGVPFFLFAREELGILQPGWELWKEQAESEEMRNRESFLLRSAAMAYQKDRAAKQQIEMVKLEMLAVSTGVTSVWQVGLAPGPGVYGRPFAVMVTAQNSEVASQMALQRYPGYELVGVRKASR
ncbi:MAG: SHD1 domain-containing protein [Pirellulaceae bacterium]|nr:SHD1 domain-containing protein [Pirellulaceae bacterium]